MEETESTLETKKHIERVEYYLIKLSHEIAFRFINHDRSKLKSPEKEIFEIYTPKLKGSTYGSDEYKSFLKEMKVALDHHYKKNRHHPYHFKNGIKGMNLVDIIEMLCDWKAATERHLDGDIFKSIELNQSRFGYSDDLKQIFINTAKMLSNKD